MNNYALKILLVEDHELARSGLVFAFNKKSSFRIVGEAENGEQAVRMAEETQPDVILMDLALPVMDGIEATQRIKRQFPNIKVIMLTSHQEGEEVHAALAAGADAYALKDIRMERLIQVIEMVHEGSFWLDPGIGRSVINSLMVNVPAPREAVTPGGSRQRYRVDLTDREMEVLQLMVDGKSNKEIADHLGFSVHTAKAHVGSIMQKLAVNDRTQAAVKALRDGLVNTARQAQ